MTGLLIRTSHQKINSKKSQIIGNCGKFQLFHEPFETNQSTTDDRIPTVSIHNPAGLNHSFGIDQSWRIFLLDTVNRVGILSHHLECTFPEEVQEPGAGLMFSVSPTALEPAYGKGSRKSTRGHIFLKG